MVLVVVFAGCTNSPQKLVEKNQENNIYSNNGSVSYKDDEYTFVGLLVDDLQKTMEIWNTPDSQGFPKLSPIIQIKRDNPISAFIVFSTIRNDVNITYDFKILQPAGTFSNTVFNGMEIVKGNVPNNLFYKARQLVTIVFDETDPFGVYQFHISIYDQKNLIKKLVLEFKLIE
jgi:hypothetical protein